MATENQNTLGHVADAIKGAARVTVRVAEEYVVRPVGEAVGLLGTNAPTAETKSQRKARRKETVRRSQSSRNFFI